VTKIIINGLMGRMGLEIANAALADRDILLVGGIEWQGHPDLGKELRELVGPGTHHVRLVGSLAEADALRKVVIDFSTAEATMDMLTSIVRNECPAVIGTTGLDDHCQKQLAKAAKKIPIVYQSNMSLGMNLLFQFTRRAAELLGEDYDIEIVEAHHNAKLDSPSGSAVTLAESAAAGRGKKVEKAAVYGRGKGKKLRKRGDIGISAIRGGSIIGEHDVMLCGPGETLRLGHTALSRSSFAQGAIAAAKWVARKKPGLYSMADVLGIK
jgi:4-hydroxy-tetrahydrodipicolinate reductase